ncbi:MAG: hypothetical protein BAJALOKI2v1_100007 [Promethearchaeota archaeon]|nr:MAG: hypothetical protein BAJALOKI2v1_100007 [Candidatus Lokiarchaeota archaeon]
MNSPICNKWTLVSIIVIKNEETPVIKKLINTIIIDDQFSFFILLSIY